MRNTQAVAWALSAGLVLSLLYAAATWQLCGKPEGPPVVFIDRTTGWLRAQYSNSLHDVIDVYPEVFPRRVAPISLTRSASIPLGPLLHYTWEQGAPPEWSATFKMREVPISKNSAAACFWSERATGFPLRSLARTNVIYLEDKWIPANWEDLSSHWDHESTPRGPNRILLANSLVNAACWGAVMLLGIWLSHAIRFTTRYSLGLCVRCGYPRSDISICPECGRRRFAAQVTSRGTGPRT